MERPSPEQMPDIERPLTLRYNCLAHATFRSQSAKPQGEALYALTQCLRTGRHAFHRGARWQAGDGTADRSNDRSKCGERGDPDLLSARAGNRVTTPSGMVLNGRRDQIEAPPVTSPTHDVDGDGKVNEIPTSIVDFMEFYLLHYFKPATGRQTSTTSTGRSLMAQIGCTSRHVPDMVIRRDRRVADVETVYDPSTGNPFNPLFATANLLLQAVPHSGNPRWSGRCAGPSRTSSPTSSDTTLARISMSASTTGRCGPSS